MTVRFKRSDAISVMLINVEMPTIVRILTFMSRINLSLSWIEHSKFISAGSDYRLDNGTCRKTHKNTDKHTKTQSEQKLTNSTNRIIDTLGQTAIEILDSTQTVKTLILFG